MKVRYLVALIGLVASASPGVAAPRQDRTSALERRSFTVVAVVDTGINPYHRDFYRPELNVHPSRYITGFPKDTTALNLTLGMEGGPVARRDLDVWARAEGDRLYWIPGTNIIGAYHPGRGTSERVIFDERGHGTGVASVAGGSIHGPNSDDILIVSIKGASDGLAWAARQPWIDIITNSWSELIPVTDQSAEASYAAVADGKIVCFASGNLAIPLWFFEGQGPSWHVNVGAVSRKTRGEHYYTGWPNDVMGHSGFPAAGHNSVDGEQPFGGTSEATPAVCGLIGKALAQTRARLGDVDEGPHGGGLAVGPTKLDGYLEDRVLDRLELEDAVQSTAVFGEPTLDRSDPSSIPASPVATYLREGYGIVEERTIKRALKVIFGAAERPARTQEDQWIATLDAARNAVYGDPP